jgi:hypothetical protein
MERAYLGDDAGRNGPLRSEINNLRRRRCGPEQPVDGAEAADFSVVPLWHNRMYVRYFATACFIAGSDCPV